MLETRDNQLKGKEESAGLGSCLRRSHSHSNTPSASCASKHFSSVCPVLSSQRVSFGLSCFPWTASLRINDKQSQDQEHSPGGLLFQILGIKFLFCECQKRTVGYSGWGRNTSERSWFHPSAQ